MKYVIRQGGNSLKINLKGDFTFMDSHAFHHMLRAISQNDSAPIINIDISQLDSIDSTALSLLMLAHDEAKRNHCSLIFKKPKGQVYDKLQEASNYNLLNIAA